MSTIRNIGYWKGIMIMALLIIGVGGRHVYANNTCNDCHSDKKFRVQNKILYDYYRNWEDSVHDLAGVVCIDCHGGNANTSEKDSAHKDRFSPLGHNDTYAYVKIPQTCGKCHDPVLNSFKKSKHFKALLEKGEGPHCVTCHGSMNAEVYYTSMISRSCVDCHNEFTKNRPEVVGKADKILHRINVSRSFRNWVTLHYSDKEPAQIREINFLYNDITNSWHTFNFEQLDEKSEDLLLRLKSMVNRALSARKQNK
jgi:formate-dependent nitrite reductase cytochrome c552 subunit